MMKEAMFAVPPTQLVQVRQLSHAAVQWPSRAARANLESKADDSHSNLGWSEDGHALVSRFLDVGQRHQLGFSFENHSLIWVVDNAVADSLNLEKVDEAATKVWCDELLSGTELQTTDHADMPYELDPVDYAGFAGHQTELETLGAWYSGAQVVFNKLVDEFRGIAASSPSIRCWPHHFDLGTLFALEEGDPETARSIGVGLSPGDDSYAEPYFYCTPWPSPELLPAAPSPLCWHTEGFTSLVCTASHIDETTDLERLLTAAIDLVSSILPVTPDRPMR